MRLLSLACYARMQPFTINWPNTCASSSQCFIQYIRGSYRKLNNKSHALRAPLRAAHKALKLLAARFKESCTTSHYVLLSCMAWTNCVSCSYTVRLGFASQLAVQADWYTQAGLIDLFSKRRFDCVSDWTLCYSFVQLPGRLFDWLIANL